MALVKYGAVVVEASGSIDGVTYSRNTFGAYARARAVPVNPNTPDQTAARTRLTSFSQQWRTLTAAERNGWNTVAASVVKQNALGEAYNPTGQQLYVGLNVNRELVGLAATSSAPTPDAAPEILGIGVTSSISGPQLDLTFSSITGSGSFLLYATPPVSPGINFFKSSLYKLVDDFDDSQTSPFDFASAYSALFPYGAAQIGSAVGLRIRPISDEGYAGTDVTFRFLVGA
jgi:hypothetical protein